MKDSSKTDVATARLGYAVVVRVREDDCEVVKDGRHYSVRYARLFPSPRTERVSPGHLVALARASDGAEVVVWRWYDAVVLGMETGLIRMWEPSHGEVLAHARPTYKPQEVGTRAYLSAGLPGADWWVVGRATAGDAAAVELDEVERLYTDHDMWSGLI